MPRYTYQAGAHWPRSLIDLTNYKDADNTVGSIIAEIKAAQEAGDYDRAQELIVLHADVLRQYTFDSGAINKYVEELRNLMIYTKQKKQQIFYEPTEESFANYAVMQDVWVGNVGDPSGAVEEGNALDYQVLDGCTFIGPDNTLHVGTMPDNGGVSIDIHSGETYTIPSGYHNGSGIVRALSASDTGGETRDLGTFENNGLKEGFDTTGCTSVFFRVEVPTVMEGVFHAINGTSILTLPREVQQFVYISGLNSSNECIFSCWFKNEKGKWEKKNSTDGKGIIDVTGTNVKIKWGKERDFNYWAW